VSWTIHCEKKGLMSAETDIRALLVRHWRASEEGDLEVEHAMYAPDAVLDYPQSGERFRGRDDIRRQRGGHPAERHFEVRRLTGERGLWVSECVITYDGVPIFTVSIMEFSDGFVTHETQYFADPFAPAQWRAVIAERMPGPG
jgi:SnoaL-like domain